MRGSCGRIYICGEIDHFQTKKAKNFSDHFFECYLCIVMGKLKKMGKVFDCFSYSSNSCSSNSCFCINSMEIEDEEDEFFDKQPLIANNNRKDNQLPTLKDVVNGNQTLAFQLKPKVLFSFQFLFSFFSYVPTSRLFLDFSF